MRLSFPEHLCRLTLYLSVFAASQELSWQRALGRARTLFCICCFEQRLLILLFQGLGVWGVFISLAAASDAPEAVPFLTILLRQRLAFERLATVTAG